MEAAEESLRAPFRAAGLDPAAWYYFGESVLERGFRGRGVGVAFFAAREARARALGRRFAAFCAVVRPDDHPARPAGHVPLDAFWTRRGYARRPGLVASFAWKDVGDAAETAKTMEFWTRALD
jgi:GNAT superfamily N-acetyltransferase